MFNQRLIAVFSISLSLFLASGVPAAERSGADASGFYGGVSVRDAAVEGPGLAIGPTASVWTRFASPVADETAGARTLVFGGYRFRNDIALEAAYSSVDRYALRPEGAAPLRRGVGLNLVSDVAGPGDPQARSWNVDVFGSWAVHRSVALYGRLGYAQAETLPGFGVRSATVERRSRDGVNYGLGLRYDMNSTLGLRFEYSRFGRFSGELPNGVPESDQLSVGMQLRF
jgi:opacity protein-like surface antigen